MGVLAELFSLPQMTVHDCGELPTASSHSQHRISRKKYNYFDNGTFRLCHKSIETREKMWGFCAPNLYG